MTPPRLRPCGRAVPPARARPAPPPNHRPGTGVRPCRRGGAPGALGGRARSCGTSEDAGWAAAGCGAGWPLPTAGTASHGATRGGSAVAGTGQSLRRGPARSSPALQPGQVTRRAGSSGLSAGDFCVPESHCEGLVWTFTSFTIIICSCMSR